MNEKQIERNYLEIKSKKELLEVKKPNSNCEVLMVNPPDFQLNKFFYKQIGNKYKWKDRLIWNDKTWIDYINLPNVKTYVIKEENDLIGYFEQIIEKNKSDCEIAYLGILENYFGKKYTCSFDHKNAFKNYLSRGMKVFKSEKVKITNH